MAPLNKYYENQNLEDVLANPEALPDIFVVANTTEENEIVDSAAVFVFDERGILHVVTGVTKTPHVYEFNVPAKNKKGDFIGVLTKNLRIGEGNCLIREDGKESEAHFYSKNRGCIIKGNLLLANREFFSEEVTSTLKEIIEKLPILYAAKKSSIPIDEWAEIPSQDYFGIKSVLQGKAKEFEHYVNILPIAAKAIGVNLAGNTSPSDYNKLRFYFVAGIATVGLCFKYSESGVPSLLSYFFYLLGAGFLIKCFAIGHHIDYETKYRCFEECTTFLKAKSIENRRIACRAIFLAEEESRQAGEDLEGPEAKEREKALRHRALGINLTEEEIESPEEEH